MTPKRAVEVIEKAVESGEFTPTKYADLGTFVCWTENTPQGKIWHQWPLETLPSEQQKLFRGRQVGESFGLFKLVACFDMWQIETAIGPVSVPRAS